MNRSLQYTVLSIMLAIAMPGCESPPVRRAELISQHPEWSEQSVKLIQEGFISQGMTIEQVKAAWGRPCHTCTGTRKNERTNKWASYEYLTQIVFFDENERVLRWSQK